MNDAVEEEEEFHELMEKSGVVPLDDEKPGRGRRDEGAIGVSTGNFSPEDKFTGRRSAKKPKLAKGKSVKPGFEPDVTIDLHGKSQSEAVDETQRAVQSALKLGYRMALVITGKGHNSSVTGGVLPHAIWSFLKRKREEGVLKGFRWAPPFLGGRGAILIYFY